MQQSSFPTFMVQLISRVAIVDLAGSEKVAQTQRDPAGINKSLLFLGQCLQRLAKGAADQVSHA